ncbi:amidase [Amycolatopsis jejuensis]|uniref:amidase n=1 Tax=Amycolatopsis jejuensis TaxID=330084 RepID=UPI0005274F6E|nr:amidase [Amycolatopsis jejuensis]
MTRPSITELGKALRRQEISAAELTADAIRAVRERNPVLNAFALVDENGATEAARQADAELASGIDRGPLHGIPVAVKDLIDVAGVPTTCGSATSSGARALRDAEVVARLRERGAIIVGKTTLHEFAYGATGDRSVHGPSRNPHDPGRMSGGSSGGSAVAVASGMVPLSLGTDTAGSVRVPAALCGTVGFKPAFDAIPSSGVYPLAPTLDHVGLFAGSVGDTLLGYEAVTDQPVQPLPDVRGIRVGWASDLAPCDPRIEESTYDLVVRAGLSPEKVAEFPGNLFEVFTTLQGKEAFDVHAHHLDQDRDLIDDEVFARLDNGRKVTIASYAQADVVRRELRTFVEDLLQVNDILALPTVPFVAPKLGERRVPGTGLEVRSALLSLTFPWNLTGVPAISVPAARQDGLPTGVQLISAPGKEHLLFAAAQAVETA